MRIALISDIHSNIEALTTALAWIDDNDIDEIFCLGDIVGYGADPNPCCELIRERCSVTLMGNHDAAVIGQMNTEYYYDAARDAIRWTRQVMEPENFQWLYSLPYSHVLQRAAFFHSAPLRPSGFYYVVETKDAVMVAHKDRVQDVKQLVNQLTAQTQAGQAVRQFRY